ncbi:MAG: DUF302 domain-containing protein [Sphingomonadaceae bacterium]
MRLADYGITVRLGIPYSEAVERAKAALKEEGFGVLTEIDVKQTLKEKLGIDTDSYVILGACNPPLAHRALSADPFVGLLLPCNVVVFRDGDATVVSAIDPVSMLSGIRNEALESVATEVRPKLERAIKKLG